MLYIYSELSSILLAQQILLIITMFYNNRSIINQSRIQSNRFFSLPIQSSHKNKCNYQTPYKLSSTTNFTRNDTLSFNNLMSKNKQTIISKKLFSKKSNIFSIQEEAKRKKSTSKSQSFFSKKSRNSSKSKTKANKKRQNVDKSKQNNKLATNTQFFRNTRGQSPGSDTTFQYMSKISKIFDLVCQNDKLPLQIESLLFKALSKLREKLRKNKKKNIGESLIAFKNDCMDIYRQSSNKEIVSFLRVNLQENNRWQPKQKQYNSLQNEIHLREKYFKSLKMKDQEPRPNDIFQLKRIEDRLDAFLQRSLKNRRVYI